MRATNILVDHMGSEFARLSPLLRQFHAGRKRLTGVCCVQRGNLFAKIICELFKFPRQGEQVPLSVDCEHTEQFMVWQRDFDGLKMESRFAKRGEFLVERLNGLSLYFKAVEKDGALHFEFYKTRFMGIPIPRFVCPRILAYENACDGRYRFMVRVHMLFVGMVLSYWGQLDLQDPEEA
ncbi:MAG: DUF4166 domain-containing protein [Cellvibrionaceae bacterium]